MSFLCKNIFGGNGLPIGWITYKPSFMETKYGGNVSDLWKAFHKEGVDVITRCGDHSKKWRATWTVVEAKQYNRLRFIIDHIVEQVAGNMDLVSQR
jgi:predicted phosphodiesterase